MFITRAYNRFEYDPVYNTITKISKESRLKDEIQYLVSVPKDLKIFFPRILNCGKIKDENYVEMENYAYSTLGDIMTTEEYDEDLWLKINKSINNILYLFSEYCDTPTEGFSQHLIDMYINKTEREYKELFESHKQFYTLCSHKEIEINGIPYDNFDVVWESVKKYINSILVDKKTSSMIHGDMCFSNILCGRDTKNNGVIIKLIDPRGSFGKVGIYGDSLYDYAKLRHSFEGGYEYIIYDKFNLKHDDNLHSFSFSFFNDNLLKIRNVFNNLKYNIDSKLIEGLIYIGMCARHYDSINRQTLMYITGIKLLNEFLTETKS